MRKNRSRIEYYVSAIVLLASLCLQFRAQAQSNSPCGPEILYSLESSVICVGENAKVVVQGIDSSESTLYDYYFDGVFTTVYNNSPTNQYDSAGTYKIAIYTWYPSIVNTTKVNCLDTLTVVVKDAPPPQFDLLPCENFGVVVQINDNFYDRYIIDYSGTLVTVTPPSTRPWQAPAFQFSTSGTRVINIKGEYDPGDCGASSSSDIVLIDGLDTPKIKTLAIIAGANENIKINFDTRISFDYFLYRNGAGANPINSLKANATISEFRDLTNINSSSNSYCYSVEVKDACGNSKQSEIICSIENFNVVAQDSRNRVSWQPYSDASRFERYELYRTDLPSAPITSFQSISERSFVDSAVNCGIAYSYFLKTILIDGAASISKTETVTAFSSTRPPAVDSIFSTYTESNQVRVIFSLPANDNTKSAFIYPSGADSASVLNSSEFLDVRNTTERKRCFSIYLFDSCDNKGIRGAMTCPVFLTVGKASFSNYNLKWTEYIEYNSGVSEYIVEKLDQYGQVYASYQFGPTTLGYSDNFTATNPDEGIDRQSQVIRYRVRAVPNDPNERQTLSNFVDVRQDNRIRIPNAFTPDGDGLNDVLEIRSAFIKDYRMLIYNRWGELVFASKAPNDFWDGRYNGNYVPSGVYAFVFDGIDYTGEEIKEKGTITVFSK